MTDATTIALAAISTAGACFSAWMASRSNKHATTSSAAARYIANSLRPPAPGPDGSPAPPIAGCCNILYENHGESDQRLRRCYRTAGHGGPHFDSLAPGIVGGDISWKGSDHE